mmetsp:Transcript_26910/g.58715  ORF Transcript_26910/g.58715 Transcript_26910/m.58715 type:complete len:290 (+) Transcript_26910:883-1752(+)
MSSEKSPNTSGSRYSQSCPSVSSDRPGQKGMAGSPLLASFAVSSTYVPACTIRSAQVRLSPNWSFTGCRMAVPSSTTPAFARQLLPGLKRMRAPLHPPLWSVTRHVCAQLYANVTSSGFHPSSSTCGPAALNRSSIAFCTSSFAGGSSGGGGSGCWNSCTGGRSPVSKQRLYPRSCVVSLYHALENVSLKACMSCANFSTSSLKLGSLMKAMSVVSIMVGCVSLMLGGRSANGLIARGPMALFTLLSTPHWVNPPWPSSATHSKLIRFWKYSLSQRMGWVVQGPSNPEA